MGRTKRQSGLSKKIIKISWSSKEEKPYYYNGINITLK